MEILNPDDGFLGDPGRDFSGEEMLEEKSFEGDPGRESFGEEEMGDGGRCGGSLGRGILRRGSGDPVRTILGGRSVDGGRRENPGRGRSWERVPGRSWILRAGAGEIVGEFFQKRR